LPPRCVYSRRSAQSCIILARGPKYNAWLYAALTALRGAWTSCRRKPQHLVGFFFSSWTFLAVRDSYRQLNYVISKVYKTYPPTYPQMYPQSNGVGHDSGGQLVVWMRSGGDTPSRFALTAGSGRECAQGVGVVCRPLTWIRQHKTQLCNFRCWQLFPLNFGLVQGRRPTLSSSVWIRSHG